MVTYTVLGGTVIYSPLSILYDMESDNMEEMEIGNEGEEREADRQAEEEERSE